MATTKAPLFGLDARGSLGKSIVFSTWRGRTYVRRHTTPANPRTGLQVGCRSVFRYLADVYAALSSAIKTQWDAEGQADDITGLNAQIRDGVDRARRNLAWRKDPVTAPGTLPDAPTGGAAAAAPKSLNLSWLRPVGNQGDYTVAIYMSLTPIFTADISNLIRVQDVATLTYTVKGLTTGTAYYFQVRETMIGGPLGTVSAEFTGTPT